MKLYLKGKKNPWVFNFDRFLGAWYHETRYGNIYRIFFNDMGLSMCRKVKDENDVWLYFNWHRELKADRLEMEHGTFKFKR